MTQSMTAFARAQTHSDDTDLCWEIRSVNHRYLEVSFRLPEALRSLEGELRSLVRGRVSRGKLECHLRLPETLSTDSSVRINTRLLDSLLQQTEKIAEERQLQNNVTLSSLLALPGVMQSAPPDIEMLRLPVVKLFEQALRQLNTARGLEGESLKVCVLDRIERLGQEIARADHLVGEQMLRAKDRLLARLETLRMTVDPSRIEQEMALFLTKMDVSEELDRLRTHVLEVSKVLNDAEAGGRRLDFLMQELNREANTLSSKSDSAALTQCAVEMKVLIEQMREQIQNIE